MDRLIKGVHKFNFLYHYNPFNRDILLQKYQDNLEFMQWFKRFFELANPDKSGYDLAGVRLRGKGKNRRFTCRNTNVVH